MSSPPSAPADEPDYNLSHPATLYAAGTLAGQPINLDPSSIAPIGDGRAIFLASLRAELPDKLRRDGEKGLVAVKVVEDDRTRVPRDGKKEARLLAKCEHANVLSLLNAYLTPALFTSRLTLFTPYYPHTLSSLLSSPSCVSSTPGFSTVVHSLAYQLLSAVAYLHAHGIAHRDICPNNVVLSREGRAVLIDFGIAVEEGDEKEGEMHFEVGTGSYRAPELIFGSRAYSPPALDVWALATLLSEFFTPLELPPPPSPRSEDSYEAEWRRRSGDLDGEARETAQEVQRKTLFQGAQSDFLLAASVFRVLGTPTVEEWPEAAHLPSFHRFTFSSFPPSSLLSHLPHLDPSAPIASILPAMLQYSAEARMPAAEALEAATKGV
ncbi:hypothetical protein JCM10213v2_008376 [Rhodosporidiobolus nylandii]